MAESSHHECVILLVLFLGFGVESQYAGIRAGSQCFHVKGVPTLKLQCPAGELIRIHTAFYGTKMRDPTEGAKNLLDMQTVCAYESGQDHCIQLTDMHENCMGRYMCSVYVSNPFLMNCRTYANYMQVNYTCVPRFAIHNLCESNSMTTSRGYLRTPHYPDANYSSNLHCACRLTTRDPKIELRMLDFSVNHTDVENCDTDYLRIGSWGRKCGIISAERLPELFVTDSQTVDLEFHSDDDFSGRGVWLEYTGSNGGPVTMTCGPSEPRMRSTKDDVIIQFTDRADIHSHGQNAGGQYETNNENIQDEIERNRNTNAFDSLNSVESPYYDSRDFDDGFNIMGPDDEGKGYDEQGNSLYRGYLGQLLETTDNVVDPSNVILETVLPVLYDTINAEDNSEWRVPYINEHNPNQVDDPYTIEKIANSNERTNDLFIHDPESQNIYPDRDHGSYNNIDEQYQIKHDQVYKPFEGPYDLPGVNDKSTKNMNLDINWNNGFRNVELNTEETTTRRPSEKPRLDSSLSEGTIFKPSFDAKSDHKNEDIPRLYGIDTVQIITGVFVGVLILIAVIIIIVLVFRRT